MRWEGCTVGAQWVHTGCTVKFGGEGRGLESMARPPNSPNSLRMYVREMGAASMPDGRVACRRWSHWPHGTAAESHCNYQNHSDRIINDRGNDMKKACGYLQNYPQHQAVPEQNEATP